MTDDVKIVSEDVSVAEVVYDDKDDYTLCTTDDNESIVVSEVQNVFVGMPVIEDLTVVANDDVIQDTVEENVISVEPEQVSSQRLLVYVPSATKDVKGIASYNSEHFIVSDGKVSLRRPSSSGEGGEIVNCGIATYDTPGSIIVGRNLSITEDGVLSVLTTNNAEMDNTLPITSAGAHVILGNIDSLLKTI